MSAVGVCLLTPAFPPDIGGQQRHALELAASLWDQGAAVQVVTNRSVADYPAREHMCGVPVARLGPVGELKGRGWRGAIPIGCYLLNTMQLLLRRFRQYDVVLVSGFNVLPIIAVCVCALTRRRCVVRVESPLELADVVGKESLAKMGLTQASKLVRAVAAVRRWAALRVDRYIAISTEIREALLRFGIPPERIVQIPNGINTHRFAPVDEPTKQALRLRLGLPPNALVVTYTGRLAVSKGVLMLAEIWRHVAPAYPNAHLAIVGTGLGSIDACDAELAQCIAEERLQGRVTLAGNVDNVHEWLCASDAFVFPSDSEGFGLSILEAMAVGLPVVTTRVGVIADLAAAAPAVLAVPPRDPNAFESALRELLDDPQLQQHLGARAKRAVEDGYSMDSVARQYLRLFTALR